MAGLGLALAALAGLAALAVVVAALRVARRRGHAAPAGLALNLGFAVFVLVAVIDGCVPVWSKDLALDQAERLGPELWSELDRLVWKLAPRGRVILHVSASVLESPIEGIDRLAVRALRAGVQIDVRVAGDGDGPGSTRADEETEAYVALVWRDRELGADLRFPLTGSADVSVRSSGALPGESECSFDGRPRVQSEPVGKDSSLMRMAERVPDLESGWHRIECSVGERSAVRYVEMTGEGVIVASRESYGKPDMSWADDESTDPADHGIQAASVSLDPSEMAGADMLIVDEGATEVACGAAKAVLERGGSVIMAMPVSADCPELIPKNLVQRVVDRRPRFTFVNDPTFDDLTLVPSCLGLECTGTVPGEPEMLPSGRQRAWIDKTCDAAHREVAGKGGSCRGAYAEGHEGDVGTRLERDPPASVTDALLLDAMGVRPAVEALRQAMPDIERGTVRDNHVVWVLSTDPQQVPDPTEFTSFLEVSGARLAVAGVNDPYARTLRAVYGGREALEGRAQGSLVSDATARFDQAPLDCKDGLRCVNGPNLELLRSLDAKSEDQAQVEQLNSGRFFPRSLQRTSGIELPAPERIAAPIRFHLWDPSAAPSGDGDGAFLPFASLIATRGPSGLSPRTLALGTMVGRGHLLLLSYSPFEFQGEQGGVPLVTGSELRWLGAQGAAEIDPLSHDPIRALYRSTRSFSGQASVGVHHVEERAEGTLDVEVHRAPASVAPDLLSLQFNDGQLTAKLVDFDFTRGSFRYRVDLRDIFEPEDRSCRTITPDLERASSIFVCPPATEQARVVLPGQDALETLARYTGGCHADHDCEREPVGRSKPGWILMASLCFAGIWARRVHRRAQARSAASRLSGRESSVQRRYDAPAAVVAAAGEWGSHATTWTRTGASGGLRPLEPGDRVSAMVVDDLIRMSQGERSVLPRMSLRIEEAAPKTVVIVNLGPSMRQPARAGRPAKVVLAAQLADLVASHAWQGRASASVRAVGVANQAIAISETTLHPGRGEVERALLDLSRRPPDRVSVPWTTQGHEAGALVYISDFLREDLEALSVWLMQTEASGVRVAGILVYSVVEYTMVETGRLASTRELVDRPDWSTGDVAREMRLRADQVERIFELASGGLTIADTAMTTQDLEMILEERRVLEVLR